MKHCWNFIGGNWPKRLRRLLTKRKDDDIYSGYPVKSSFDVRMKRYDTKIARLQEAKAAELEEEARRVKKEEEKRAERKGKAAASKVVHKNGKRSKVHGVI
ncbi:hypothetical protein BDZ94DRAFT_1316635 [Collybia nuda]|uniref:Uncharacterized protein n=1 Tax=Collybia nuda TaxID=64659 RepID=A0A9P5XP70_9AGAR|nr:hypothetical protein BDZ94DRAFT_1316635 [Collybia nuda]